MSFSKISALGGLVAFASKVAAHGTVTGIVADGVYYEGYSASFQYLQTQPKVVGWSIPEDLSNGFIAPDAYNSSDIICHLAATNAQASAPVKAGGIVELQWTAWPSSHHGPVIDYLANCNGDCSTVDKTTLEWFKIDAQGLYDDTTVPGNWASDTLIANNNSWSVTIPTDIASGNYVLRHEIIALHSAEEADGAQNYPQCVNLEITGTGTATPSGTLGTALYSETEAGILVNIYASLSTYDIPGPTLYSGAISMSETQQPSATAVSSGIIGAGTGAASVASTTEAASSVAISAVAASSSTSSAAGVAVTSSSISGLPTQVAVTSAPYGNSTVPTSTKKSKSACKSKSKTTSPAILGTSSAINVGAVVTSSSTTITNDFTTETLAVTSADSVTIATSAPTSVAAGTSYDSATVARRHARDLAARQMNQFTGLGVKATGTATAGFGGHHHHHHPHGTGAFGSGGFAKPTGKSHFKAAGF
ncbi:uncharacterized protein LY89DRAFT_697291 [Mollisia scopiformis]|uniref:Auxiliary Activity family 9 catalytic domain-containing protein n=1 Tax=Mollisia scopiformis TaxID=149040 RepID=A0A194XA50_MOLSC|nr:uncharacterized protein LY89DRAFT_697291 [Mollisia scopiformis]KUJ17046.1 hypothetical protein LY89DRAFT_697291 [Mollisia scopiformis]